MNKKELEIRVEELELSYKNLGDLLKNHKCVDAPKHMACGFQFSPGYRVYGTKDAISKLKEELKSPIQSGSIGDLFDGEE